MLKEAEDHNIEIEKELVNRVNQCCSRFISERNLRKQRDLFADSIAKCEKEQVDKLQTLIDEADKNQVEEEYIKNAQKLTN